VQGALTVGAIRLTVVDPEFQELTLGEVEAGPREPPHDAAPVVGVPVTVVGPHVEVERLLGLVTFRLAQIRIQVAP